MPATLGADNLRKKADLSNILLGPAMRARPIFRHFAHIGWRRGEREGKKREKEKGAEENIALLCP
jgi:predicted transposase YdaD